jgi:hypothetical protein
MQQRSASSSAVSVNVCEPDAADACHEKAHMQSLIEAWLPQELCLLAVAPTACHLFAALLLLLFEVKLTVG